MADGTVGLDEPTEGRQDLLIETEVVGTQDVGGRTVEIHRQRVALGDGNDPDEFLTIAGGAARVTDDYATVTHAPDQTGAGGVLTFTVTDGALVMVDVDPEDPADADNYRARATVDGTTPTATVGFVCRPGTSYLPVPTAGTVAVWAPSGVTVAVQVCRR